jgi:hypothetical protein
MSTLPIPDPPKPTKGDVAHSLVRAGVSAIPVAGGPVAEVFSMAVTTPLEKRRRKWEEQMVSVVKALAERSHIDLDELRENETFNSILIQATVAAVKTHQAEKLTSLRNAVANAALGNGPDEDLALLFVRFVDELTPLHLRVLRVMAEHEAEFAFSEGFEQLFAKFSEVGAVHPSRELFKLVCEDLKARALLRISPEVNDFPGIFTTTGLAIENQSADPKLIVPDLGRKFIDFVLIDHTA